MLSIQSIDKRRESISVATPARHKTELGQFLTPSIIAKFMAGLFNPLSDKEIRILDAGAGIGTLTAAFVERAASEKVASLTCEVWEVDTLLADELRITLDECSLLMQGSGSGFSETVVYEDFIESFDNLFSTKKFASHTHAILNPPYKKINSNSSHRFALRALGIETTNLYSAFVALALIALDEGGELVAITPRSFCNGTYFRPFRELIFRLASLDKIHIFESRTDAFKGDDVLQENVIFHLIKGKNQGAVTISSSTDASFTDIKERIVPFDQVISPGDKEMIMHLACEVETQSTTEAMECYTKTLEEIGLSVSTGPVVDFRLREHLCDQLKDGVAPLIYAHHFDQGFVVHPKIDTKKPNGILISESTNKWLMPIGNYLVVRRLSSKEEKRRIIPAVFNASHFDDRLVGFENHLNVFHFQKKGLPLEIVKGLAIYLGSTFTDKWLRRFSGHTQVNAGDLRALRYPDIETLAKWGNNINNSLPSQTEIDAIVEGKND